MLTPQHCKISFSHRFNPSQTGVEVFVFDWGCIRLGALGDDQEAPIICALRETEPILPLQDMF